MIALAPVVSASAAQLTGGYAISGNFNWVNNATGAVVPVLTSNPLDFEVIGNTPTPGVPGIFVVNNSTGDFAGLGNCPFACTFGSIEDFTFDGPGNANYPALPLASFETVGGFTFDLLSLESVSPNINGSLDMTGTGVFHAPGFEDTPGIWAFSGQNAGGIFSFSASQAAVSHRTGTSNALGLGHGTLGTGCQPAPRPEVVSIRSMGAGGVTLGAHALPRREGTGQGSWFRVPAQHDETLRSAAMAGWYQREPGLN